MDTRKAIRIERQYRKRRYLDRVLLFLFPMVFARFACGHLSRGVELGCISNAQWFELDASIKGDLDRPGFKHFAPTTPHR